MAELELLKAKLARWQPVMERAIAYVSDAHRVAVLQIDGQNDLANEAQSCADLAHILLMDSVDALVNTGEIWW